MRTEILLRQRLLILGCLMLIDRISYFEFTASQMSRLDGKSKSGTCLLVLFLVMRPCE